MTTTTGRYLFVITWSGGTKSVTDPGLWAQAQADAHRLYQLKNVPGIEEIEIIEKPAQRAGLTSGNDCLDTSHGI